MVFSICRSSIVHELQEYPEIDDDREELQDVDVCFVVCAFWREVALVDFSVSAEFPSALSEIISGKSPDVREGAAEAAQSFVRCVRHWDGSSVALYHETDETTPRWVVQVVVELSSEYAQFCFYPV